eukprot:c18612_g1_i1.p1 GENE.c18612_g1_i1~~c18612_g1_i1.p1  ORF type:complete len:244 (-),score=92.92 c18612_g1_i1:36-767(-)
MDFGKALARGLVDQDVINRTLKRKDCYFNEEEIKMIWIRFDQEGMSGIISYENFVSVFGPGFFAKRLFDIIKKKFSKVTFEELVCFISFISMNAPLELRMKSCFQAFTITNEGYITNEDLLVFFQAIIKERGLAIPEEYIISCVDATFQEINKKGDGKIDFEEFKTIFSPSHPGMLLGLMGETWTLLEPNWLSRLNPIVALRGDGRLNDVVEPILRPSESVTRMKTIHSTGKSKSFFDILFGK